MVLFTTFLPSEFSGEDLLDRIKEQELNPQTKELYRNLLRGSFVDGATTRFYFDADSMVLGMLHRQDYERAVTNTIPKFSLSSEQEKLAFDIALFSFSWGYGLEGSMRRRWGVVYPHEIDCPNRMLDALQD